MTQAKRVRTLAAPVLLALAFVCCFSRPAFAGYLLPNGNIGITVDENCHGTIDGFTGVQPLPCNFQNDPGPGGLPGVMTYSLLNPPGLVAGDLLLFDPVEGLVLDVIRFNPN